jgi:osmotically-inducible protein OsmY
MNSMAERGGAFMRKEDEQIKQDIQASLAWDSRLDASSINIAVDNGVVTLSGEVDTFARKWAAAEDSRRVQGVRDLRNDIQVRPSWMRSDDEITQDVISAFNWDSRVDPKEITVSCENGVVTLNGAVDSFAERRAAREDAW